MNGHPVGMNSAMVLARAPSDLSVRVESHDVNVVGLDGAGQRGEGAARDRQSKPVVNKSRRLRRHAEGATPRMRRDSVLRVRDEPNGRGPLVESKGRVLSASSELQ